MSDETLSNQRYQNLINHRKKAEFKAPKMKPMRFIQTTPKAKTKILSQKRKTPNDSKGKSSQKARLIQKIMKKKTWLVKSLMVH